MKKAIFLSIVSFLFIFLFGCQNSSKSSQNTPETELLMHIVFNEAFLQKNIMIEFDSIKGSKARDTFLFITDEKVSGPENWIESPSVCNDEELKKVFISIIDLYDNNPFQLRIDAANESENRKIYHRIPRL